ncbi:MAG: hemerythrin domain-containing protein [Leptolyngbyaceae cyanobacterium RU_5_1]|nr:hemerythrin domain-containing protein [Leptolyngbyaceae cyanobacterium RU_5_1]
MASSKKADSKKTDILSLIETDHREVEKLFKEIESAKNSNKAQEYFDQIYKELTLHAQAEELVFYPEMREYKETEKYIEEAEQEHNSVKILLEQMKALKPGDSEFETKMTHLKESVTHHVEEEESEIFSAIRKCMDEQKLHDLGQEFQETKTKLEPDVKVPIARK